MAGIEETKDVVKFAVELAEAAAKTFEDKKISLADLPHFVGPAIALPAAISGISAVPTELSDLDDAEKAELLQFIKDEFDIPQDNIEEIAESALALCIDIFNLVQQIIDAAKGTNP